MPESSLPASQILDRFRRLCEVLPLAVLETDVDEDLLYQNPRWEEISGQDEEASKDQGWRDAIHAEDREWVLEEATLARGQNRMFDADFRISRPDKRERWVHGRSLPLYSGPGWHDGFLHMIYDITDRKLIEETLRDSLAELTIKRATENGEVAATATQVKESLVEAKELVQSLREADPADGVARADRSPVQVPGSGCFGERSAPRGLRWGDRGPEPRRHPVLSGANFPPKAVIPLLCDRYRRFVILSRRNR